MDALDIERELDAFRRRLVEPGQGVDPAEIAASTVFKAVREQEEYRKSNDWAFLERYRAANEHDRASVSVSTVFIGASITENWALADPSFFTRGTINRGISGQTSSQLLVRFFADVVRTGARTVHLMVGTNDAAGNTGAVTDEAFQNNIRAMVDISTANDMAVVLGSITPASSFPWSPGVDPRPAIARWNAWLRPFAAERGIPYADYYSALVDDTGGLRSELTNDAVHPHRLGYEIMRPIAEHALASIQS